MYNCNTDMMVKLKLLERVSIKTVMQGLVSKYVVFSRRCHWFVLVQPGQHIQVVGFRISTKLAPRHAVLPVPRAAVRVRPLQHTKLPAKRRVRARFLVPRAAVCAQPL
jgi:hypothetical protein